MRHQGNVSLEDGKAACPHEVLICNVPLKIQVTSFKKVVLDGWMAGCQCCGNRPGARSRVDVFWTCQECCCSSLRPWKKKRRKVWRSRNRKRRNASRSEFWKTNRKRRVSNKNMFSRCFQLGLWWLNRSTPEMVVSSSPCRYGPIPHFLKLVISCDFALPSISINNCHDRFRWVTNVFLVLCTRWCVKKFKRRPEFGWSDRFLKATLDISKRSLHLVH